MNGRHPSATEDPEEEDKVPLVCSWRLMLAILAFLCFVFNYSQRMGMSVAIVCMVNHTALGQAEAEAKALNGEFNVSVSNLTERVAYGAVPEQCQANAGGSNSSVNGEDGPFLWDKDVQGHILGSFFYGYLISQIPGGILAERYGGKWVFGVSLGIATVATLLTPVAATLNMGFLIFLRVIVGVGSVSYPQFL